MPDPDPHAPAPGASPPSESSFPARPEATQLYRHARREALIVCAVWAVALAWTVGYSYLHGYRHAPESWVVRAGLAEVRPPGSIPQHAGLPDWVLFGILLPWVSCSLFTVIFCLFVMRDDDLGREAEEGAGDGH
jgi:hypothetical protein